MLNLFIIITILAKSPYLDGFEACCSYHLCEDTGGALLSIQYFLETNIGIRVLCTSQTPSQKLGAATYMHACRDLHVPCS